MVTVGGRAARRRPDVLRVLDEGNAHSPYLDVFRRARRSAPAPGLPV